MARASVLRSIRQDQIELGGRRVDYRLIASRSARKLRVRVGTNGIEVLQPANRTADDVVSFLECNGIWILDQLHRVERLRKIRMPERYTGEILYRGEPTLVRVEDAPNNLHGNRVSLVNGDIVVQRGRGSPVPTWRSLENWLRRKARTEIEKQVRAVCSRLRQSPGRIYIMGQRTKWGNCSSQRNLSFNWRLIMAPEPVFRYLVTHEVVHLAVPDHSAKFWLTVQSLCRETERAKQWLVANSDRLTIDLERVCVEPTPVRRRG